MKINLKDFMFWTDTDSIQQQKVAGLAALVAGLMCHSFMLMNKLPNHDELQSYSKLGNTVEVGRPFLRGAQAISGWISSPWIQGLVAICYIAIIAMILVKIFRIKNRYLCAFVGIIMVTFPAVACSMSYMFSADTFFLASLCAVFSTMVLAEKIDGDAPRLWGWTLLSSVILAVGMCVYPAAVAFSVMLIVMILITDQVHSTIETDVRKCIAKILWFLLYGLSAVVLYFLVWKGSAFVLGIEIADYKGTGDIGLGLIQQLLGRVVNAYKEFFWYMFSRDSHTSYSFLARISTICITIFVFVMYVFQAIRNKWKSKLLKWLYLSVLLCVLPVAAEFIYVMVPKTSDVNYHMIYSLSLWYVLFVAVLDNCFTSGRIRSTCIRVVFLAMLVIVQWDNWLFTANSYNAAYMAYEQAYAYSLKMSMRIEEVEGFSYELPIAIVGGFNFEDKPETLEMLRPFTYLSDEGKQGHPRTALPGELTLLTTYNYYNIFKFYLGEDYNLYSRAKAQALSEQPRYAEELEAMPEYPAEGSMKIIDGILFIKR